jgi:predicted transposase YdaD
MFDNVCKFMAETRSSDFATWLLGEPITFTELKPSELSLEPIRADALILLQSEQLVLHLEFQVEPDKTMPCIFRSDIMKESVIYQEIRAEAIAEGEVIGEARGEARLILRLLSKKFGTLSDRYQTTISNLALEQMESLSEALLDFSNISDLDHWLNEN